MTVEMLLIAGAITGLVIGLAASSPKLGCAALWIVPLTMIAYVYAWHSCHPESLRSTSGLEFLFGPLWPSLGAMVGFVVGTAVRYLILSTRNGS